MTSACLGEARVKEANRGREGQTKWTKAGAGRTQQVQYVQCILTRVPVWSIHGSHGRPRAQRPWIELNQAILLPPWTRAAILAAV